MKYTKLMILVLVAAIALLAVAPAFAADPIPPKNGEKYVVGMAIVGLQHPFFTNMKAHLEAEAKRQGVDVVVLDALADVGKQMSQIEDLIQQDVDLLMVVPVKAEALTPSVEAANAAGIPVVVVDRRLVGGQYLNFSSTDNVAVGRGAGDYIATRLGGKGKVVEIEGQPGAGPTLDRGRGFNEVIATYPEMEVVFRQTGEFQRAKGMEVMENVIQSGQEFDAVFCHNDEMAGGVREALAAHDMTGKVVLVGCDAQADAMQAIKDGTMDATFVYPPQSGQAGMIEGLKYLRGEDYKAEVWLPTALVTQGNVDYYMNITY
jgi:ribose transport system substrate-binding protein